MIQRNYKEPFLFRNWLCVSVQKAQFLCCAILSGVHTPILRHATRPYDVNQDKKIRILKFISQGDQVKKIFFALIKKKKIEFNGIGDGRFKV